MATKKTTIYLPDELKADIAAVAAGRGLSEAETIRLALREFLDRDRRPTLTLPLFDSGRGDLSGQDEELLAEGFGQD